MRQVVNGTELPREQPSRLGVLLVLILLTAATLTADEGFFWVALGLLLASAALCFRLHVRGEIRGPAPTTVAAGFLIASIILMCCLPAGADQGRMSCAPSAWNRFETSPGEPCGPAIRAGACAALAMSLLYVAIWKKRGRRGCVIGLAAIAAAARVLILFSSPAPRIDVHVSQTEGARALLGRYVVVTEVAEAGPAARIGVQPGDIVVRIGPVMLTDPPDLRRAVTVMGSGAKTYLILLRNGITGKLPVTLAASPPPVSPPVAAGAVCLPELGIAVERYVDNVYAMTFPSPTDPGQTFNHYAYPPLTLYCNAASWEFFKDVRVFWILGDLFGALAIWLVARRLSPTEPRFAELIALAFLYLPRSLLVIEQSWTEPLCVATLSGLALALCYGGGTVAAGCLLGLWLSSKQYMALGIPQILRLRRIRPAGWLWAAAVGIAIALPFMVWNFAALYRSLFGHFLTSAPSLQTLSLYSALARVNLTFPAWLALLVWVPGLAFFTWRMRPTLAGALFSMAATWLLFFILGKQAAQNYFYLISFALLLAAAATPRTDERPEASMQISARASLSASQCP